MTVHRQTSPSLLAAVLVSVGLMLAFTGAEATADEADAIQEVLDGLQDLPFDEFVDASYEQILLRTPELVTSMGLSRVLGIRDDRLDDICNSYVADTYRLKAGIREILGTYDLSALSYEQRISHDSYSWLLADWQAEQEFMYHVYPVTHGFSRQNDLFRFLEDEHPLETLQNVEDYISRLEQVDDQFACLISNLEDSEERGIMAPAQMLQRAADGVRGVVPGSATDLPFYTALAAKITSIDEINEAQRQDLLSRAVQAIDSSVIPAYQSLVAVLDEQIPRAPPMNGVWQLPDGHRYYDALLKHHTTTDLSAAEIHQTGLDEVARIRAEIRVAFDLLGYPAGDDFAPLFERVAVDSGVVRAADIVPLNEGFIRQAQEDILAAFDIAPQAEVIVRGGAGGGFYVAGSLDGSRPGAYYIGNQRDDYRYWMRTIAYHEAVPGHHFQIALGNEQDVPLFTKGGNVYTAFVEGWALYAELLAKELGWYEDDPYSELGRLQWELLRGARMVVDTGLHHFGWSRQQAIDYFVDQVGTTTSQAAQQVDLYLYWPGYFTAYKTGMLKILELRQYAIEELGELFDIKAFHRAVLLHNRLPLPLLERLVQDYVFSTLQQAGAPDINRGHSGAWFNPATSGQGQLIEVVPEDQFMFLGWFTFTDAASDSPYEQHWYTAQGHYTGNTAELILHETLGGQFDSPQPPTTSPVGTLTVSFSDCRHGQMAYRIDADGRQGTLPLQRLIPGSDNYCQDLADGAAIDTAAVDISTGMDGAWVNNDTLGQGFLIDAHPDAQSGKFLFVAWFTYGDDTESGQRWLTAQGSFEGSAAAIDVHETTGGLFDDPQAVNTSPAGTMTIDFTDCSHAQLSYTLTADDLQGDMAITRLIPGANASCEEPAGAN